jgi:hypothetical protein
MRSAAHGADRVADTHAHEGPGIFPLKVQNPLHNVELAVHEREAAFRAPRGSTLYMPLVIWCGTLGVVVAFAWAMPHFVSGRLLFNRPSCNGWTESSPQATRVFLGGERAAI